MQQSMHTRSIQAFSSVVRSWMDLRLSMVTLRESAPNVQVGLEFVLLQSVDSFILRAAKVAHFIFSASRPYSEVL